MTTSGNTSHSPAFDKTGTPRNSFKSELIPPAIIVAFIIVLMWPFTFQGKALMPDTWKSIHPWARGVDLNDNNSSIYDTVLEYGPWFEYAQQCLKEGRVPHWNPWQFCGAPLYANRLVPFFFPPFVVAELVAHPHKIIGWFQLFNLVLSGWGMYLLFRRWRMTRWVATAGSILWLTCGVHFLPFPLWTLGTVGFPWLLWALERFLEKPGIRPVIVAGIIAGLILMAGYPILVVHLSYFTFIYYACRWFTTRRIGPNRIHWTLALTAFAAVYLFGIGLSAIANVPAYHYSQETVRQVEGFADRAFEQEKLRLITPQEEAGIDPVLARFGERMDILLPINGRGTFRAWQYGGVLIFLLAFLGILAGRPRAVTIGILGFLFAILVWIPEAYIFLLDYLPGWKVTILLPIEVLNLAACMLAAFGLEALIDGKWAPNRYGKILFALIAAASIAMTYRFLRNAPVINLPILTQVAEPNLLAVSPYHVFYLAGFAFLAILMAVAVLVRWKLSRLRWGITVAVIGFSMGTYWHLQPVYSECDYTPSTPLIERLVQMSDETSGVEANRLARWARLPLPFNPHKRAKSPFIPNLNMPFGLRDVGGYDSLVPRRYIEYGTLFDDRFFEYRALIAYRADAIAQSRWFRAMGVRWLISQDELPVESGNFCTLVWDDRADASTEGTDYPDDFVQVWEIDEPSPRAFLTRRVAFSNDPMESALVLVANLPVQGVEAVVIEDPDREDRTFAHPDELENGNGLVLEGGQVKMVRDDPEHLVIETHAPEGCYLVLRDGWFPEWAAYVDGRETPIFPADYAFRAIEVPQGDHTVEFRYVPRSFRLGMWVTAGTILLMLALYPLPALSGGRTRNIKPTPSNL